MSSSIPPAPNVSDSSSSWGEVIGIPEKYRFHFNRRFIEFEKRAGEKYRRISGLDDASDISVKMRYLSEFNAMVYRARLYQAIARDLCIRKEDFGLRILDAGYRGDELVAALNDFNAVWNELRDFAGKFKE